MSSLLVQYSVLNVLCLNSILSGQDFCMMYITYNDSWGSFPMLTPSLPHPNSWDRLTDMADAANFSRSCLSSELQISSQFNPDFPSIWGGRIILTKLIKLVVSFTKSNMNFCTAIGDNHILFYRRDMNILRFFSNFYLTIAKGATQS